MSNHNPYIFTPAAKMHRDGIICNIVRFFSRLRRLPEPDGRGRIIPGYLPQHSNGTGYYPPCYPSNMKHPQPSPVDRGTLARAYTINDGQL